MKKLIPILFLIISACSTSKVNSEGPVLFEVHFGNYGGFSNLMTEYVLYESGQVSKIENKVPKPLNRASKKEVKKIKEHLQSIEFEKLKINESGNLTYFINVRTKDYENKVRWNDNSQNTELQYTYKMLIETLK